MHKLGEIMYLSALGEGILVLNSQRVAIDLLEKRSNIYSGRPRYITANDYLSEGLTVVLSPYCDMYAIDTQLSYLTDPPCFIESVAFVASLQKASLNQPYSASTPSKIARQLC